MIDTNSVRAKKKARWNKNKKKNWRKKIDISDVEDKLDRERLEIRTTGGLLRDRADHELFVIEKDAKDISKVGKKRKRLTIDKIIVPNPDAVIPPSQRNVAKLRRRQQRLKLMGELKIQTRKSSFDTSAKKFSTSCENTLDLWSKNAKDVEADVFAKNNIAKHTEVVIGKAQLKRPKHLFNKPQNRVKAVEVISSGSSYNPAFDDHQNLLFQEYQKEVNKLKEEQRIERSVMVDSDTIATQESLEKELKEGLFDEENSYSEDEEEANSIDGQNPPQIIGLVSKKKRKAKSKQNMEEMEKQTEWADKLRENEVYRIKTFMSEIRKKEKQIEQKKLRKQQKFKQPVLSYSKFREPDQDFKLSSEITGSLRELKPEGNLLVDRYKSLQKRCIIEPRQKFKPPRRKYKVKYQEKRSFREIEL